MKHLSFYKPRNIHVRITKFFIQQNPLNMFVEIVLLFQYKINSELKFTFNYIESGNGYHEQSFTTELDLFKAVLFSVFFSFSFTLEWYVGFE